MHEEFQNHLPFINCMITQTDRSIWNAGHHRHDVYFRVFNIQPTQSIKLIYVILPKNYVMCKAKVIFVWSSRTDKPQPYMWFNIFTARDALRQYFMSQ